mgnify:CR=1 FL=1
MVEYECRPVSYIINVVSSPYIPSFNRYSPYGISWSVEKSNARQVSNAFGTINGSSLLMPTLVYALIISNVAMLFVNAGSSFWSKS